MTFTNLTQFIKVRAARSERYIVAISGAPASGKSTLAADLVTWFGHSAAVLPMDGFHLHNDALIELGLFHRKGAPETFDAEGFVYLMRNLRQRNRVSFPTFDRETDRTIPAGGCIGVRTRIVLVEGNYLLLNIRPWSDLAEIFDLTVSLDVSRETLVHRLIMRWRDHGLSDLEARMRALGNDIKNADFMAKHSRMPDLVLRTEA
ncbi:hypothetical protein [Sulfitobacter sp. F26169L]|uniref:hypothetical protein n=1 Tax=Sulfitobacter sp. F26169L TaxID=2996015 RepID=UPI002260FBC3|nr:hypothetical protein [Sulfitobacter sp. F26169L]